MSDPFHDHGWPLDAKLNAVVPGPNSEVPGQVARQRSRAAHVWPVTQSLQNPVDPCVNRISQRRELPSRFRFEKYHEHDEIMTTDI
jgi:hypothetical protein